MSREDVFLEVIAATVDDAIAAERGGALRLEVVRALDQGGLTPAVEEVRAICAAVSIPVRVMVRETPTFSIAHANERAHLCAAASAFAALGVDGLVLGFLNGGTSGTGVIDVESTGEVLACAPELKATFHRAFEAVHDPAQAMSALKQLPQIDRILVRGGHGHAAERQKQLEALARMSEPQIGIVAGGNVTREDLECLCRSPWLREFHVGRAVRDPEEPLAPVRSAKVRQVLADMEKARRQGQE